MYRDPQYGGWAHVTDGNRVRLHFWKHLPVTLSTASRPPPAHPFTRPTDWPSKDTLTSRRCRPVPVASNGLPCLLLPEIPWGRVLTRVLTRRERAGGRGTPRSPQKLAEVWTRGSLRAPRGTDPAGTSALDSGCCERGPCCLKAGVSDTCPSRPGHSRRRAAQGPAGVSAAR